jgi:DNA-directed RNA polymerase specialized sigma24 family protein
MANLNKELERIEQGKAWEESDEVVQLDVKKPLDKVIPIRLPAADWAKLREEARELGIGPTTLARMWLLERLRLQSSPLQGSAHVLHKLLVQSALQESLSPLRDAVILEHIAQGYENKEIADELAISKETVKRRAAEILRQWELLRERMAPGESKQKV